MKLTKPTFVVSSRAQDLAEISKKSPNKITIWVRSGKYKNKMPIIRSAVTYEAKSLPEANDYKRRFISTFCPPKSHLKLSVLKGLSKKQIFQLIIYTKTDGQIKRYTHDYERFKNIKAFTTWKNRGKIIYTLADRSGKLNGIVWFARKTYKNARYTFAIRTYKPIRGKGVAKKFMDIAIRHFHLKKKGKIWLETTKENIPANKLYKDFGFKKISSSSEDRIIMVLPD